MTVKRGNLSKRRLIAVFQIPVFCIVVLGESTTIRLQDGLSLPTGPSYDGCEDTYLREAYPDACPGKFQELWVGYEGDGSGGKARALIRFDLSFLKNDWETDTRITGARLKLSS